jgi:hypothetical protein
MRTKRSERPGLSNQESAMSELEYDRLLDAVRLAVAPAPETSLLNTPAKAAKNKHRSGPLSRYPEDCFGFG